MFKSGINLGPNSLDLALNEPCGCDVIDCLHLGVREEVRMIFTFCRPIDEYRNVCVFVNVYLCSSGANCTIKIGRLLNGAAYE